MTDRNASPDPSVDPSLFAARLTPHRSLSRAGFLLLMAVLGGISFAAGMVFLVLGAWPVFGFVGLDVLLVYWAFRANDRDARFVVGSQQRRAIGGDKGLTNEIA